MKRTYISVLGAFCLILASLIQNSSPGIQEAVEEQFAPDEILIKFKPDIALEKKREAVEYLRGRILTHTGQELSPGDWDSRVPSKRSFLLSPDTLHLKLPEDVGTERALEALKGNLDIEYAEKNSIGHFFILPDDLRFGELWGLHNTGQTEGTPDADIDAPEAWDVFTGSSDIIVAVIDTGIAWNHVDLQANMWVNIDEIPGNEVDDDGNGYIDDYHGWNFAADPDNNWPMDDHYPWYHGTHIAGTIGASGNNHEGIAGVCWNVKLLAIKVGGYSGPDDANVARGIEYAVNNGAKISNLSVGFTYYSQTLFNAIQMARSAGHLVVAAAGNYPQTPQRDNDKTPIYPASYALDNIIAVLSTNHWDNLSSFSHYGKNSVDLGAPGGDK